VVFNSISFAIFFAVVFALYHLLPGWNARKVMLLVASYLFYAAWNPLLIVLLWISTLIDWVAARAIARAPTQHYRRAYLVVSLASNLGMLAAFKYGGFFLETFATGASWIGIEYAPPVLDLILPVGISFYTFQTLSYTIDVYRRELDASVSLLDFALFVTFFPQLVAGPIVRARDFLPQLEKAKRFDPQLVSYGLCLLVIGLFEKLVLSDTFLAPIVDHIYAESRSLELSTRDAWVGTLAFSGQIFFDFSGYSLCAIGAALCFGFRLADNFHFPYAAAGFSEFWRRWHISLSTWLRDYLYVPLGGNRQGALRTQANLMITMLLGGLWHGAAWTFVAWGALHGAYLVLERLLRAPFSKIAALHGPAGTALATGVTYAGVCFAWVLFRAEDFVMAKRVLAAMVGGGANEHVSTPSQLALVGAIVGGLLLAQVVFRERSLGSILDRTPWWLTSPALAACALFIFTSAGDDRAFIYFRF
jgi:alginate O-acetyltransferase complex protein AlgI